MQEIDVRRHVVHGGTGARGLAIGHRFELTGHTVKTENAEHLVVATRIEIAAGGGESGAYDFHFDCRFTAVRANSVWRPQRLTPKPVIPGPQHAVVCDDQPATSAEEGTNAGHVKVKFLWGDNADQTSIAVRVSSSWASNGYGQISLPRVNDEVIVDFLEGDPDRPIVTGRVYNGKNVPKYKLPDHRYVSTIRSNFVGGGGYNEIRMDDRSGSEHLHLWAGKDYYRFVKNESFVLVDKNESYIVSGDRKLQVEKNFDISVTQDRSAKVDGNDNLKVTGNVVSEATGKVSTKTSSDFIVNAATGITLKSDIGLDVKAGANIGMDGGANVHIKGGANVVIEAGGILTLKGNMVVIDGGGAPVFIKGATVMINSGGSGAPGSGASPKSADAPKSASAPSKPSDKIP